MADRKGHYRYENVTNLTDDFLRLKPTGSDDESWEINHCQICLGAFSDPRTLACMHTFCRECLQTAINQTSGGKKYDRGFRCVLCGYFTKMLNYSIPRDQWANHVPFDYRFPESVDQTDSMNHQQPLNEAENVTRTEDKPKWILDWKISTFPKSYLLNRGLNPFKRLKNCYIFAITPDTVRKDNYPGEDDDDDDDYDVDDDDDDDQTLKSNDVESEITAVTFYIDTVIVYDNGLQEIQIYNTEMTLESTIKQKGVHDIAVLNSKLYMTVPTDACMKVYNLVGETFDEDLNFTKKCYGMDILDNKIAVLMLGENEDICQLCYLKTEGIIGDIVELKGGRLKFQCPSHVAFCPLTRLVYVTDRKAGLVKCYRLDGQLHWERLVFDPGTVAVYGGKLLISREFTSTIDILIGKGECSGRLESMKYTINQPQCMAVSKYKSDIVFVDGNQLIHLFAIVPYTVATPRTESKESKSCVVL